MLVVMDVIIETPLEELYKIPTNYVVVGEARMNDIANKNGWYLDGFENDSISTFYHFENDKIHCDDGPARIETLHSFPDKIYSVDWYNQNKKHRLDGPAEIWLELSEEKHHSRLFCYKIDGIQLSEEQYWKHHQIIKHVINSIVEL